MSLLNPKAGHAANTATAYTADPAALGQEIVAAAAQVHKTLGPGLLQEVYEEAFICELKDRNIAFERQELIPFSYKNHSATLHYKLDLLVENQIVIELKAVDALLPVHKAQVLTYLKLTGLRTGYLINFNVPALKDGLKKIVL